MSEHVSASDSAPQVVSTPLVVSDEMFTVVSHSHMAPSTVESIKADLADAPAPPADAAPAETDAAEGEHAPEGDAPAEDTAAPPEGEKKPGRRDRVGRLQAEIHALTREKYQTRAEIEELSRKREQLRREMGEPPAKPAASPADAPAEPVAAAARATVHPDDARTLGPRPSWAQYDAAGKEFAEYEADLDVWTDRKTDLRIARETQAVTRRAQESATETAVRDQAAALEASHHAQLAEIEREDPQFQSRVKEVLDQFEVTNVPPPDQRGPNGEIGHFLLDTINAHDAGPRVLQHWVNHPDEIRELVNLSDRGRLTGAMMIAVRSAEDPVPLLQHLATHPQETAEIGSLPRDKALLALGQISARLDGAKHQASPTTVAPVTRAPSPVRPVGGTRTTGDAVDIYDLPPEQFLEAYRKRENAARSRRP